MGYLIFQILFFLLLAAVLGILIGWFWRGHRFQSELHDLDSRWRTKLGEVESERERFVGEVNQANEVKAKYEASALEAKRLAETHEKNLQKSRREQETKTSSLADKDKLAAKLQADLKSRDEALAKANNELAKGRGASADAGRLGKDLAAANERASTLEGDLQKAREANSACKSDVERLKAQIADLQLRAGSSGAGDRAMGLMSSAGGTGDTGGSAGEGRTSGSSSGTLGLVGGREVSPASGGSGQAGRPDPNYTQRAASPPHLAEAGSKGFAAAGAGSSDADAENEGVRPEALSDARDGRADDLKRISGVGPKLERTLNGLGIYHFSQIAAFTPDNVAWVDRHLRFKGRIERENWIEQSRILAAGGETEFSKRQ